MKVTRKIWNSEKECFETIEVKNTMFADTQKVVDDSKYIPNVNSLNNIVGMINQINADDYEFKDGKDTGERNYPLRDISLDVTEKDAYINKCIAEGKVEKEKGKKLIDDTIKELEAEKQTAKQTETANKSE